MRKFKLIIIFLALSGLLLTGCSKEKGPVKIGYLALTNSIPLYTAIEKGYFEKHDIDYEIVQFQTSNDLVEALVSGRIDVQISASTSVLYAIEARAKNKIRIFSVNLQTKEKYPDYIIARRDANISEITDLENKKIGIFPGSTFNIMAKIVFGQFFDLDKIELEQIPPQSQIEALSSGSVDAIFTLDPFSIIAIEKADGVIIEKAVVEKYVQDPLPAGANAFSQSYVSKNPDEAKRFVQAFDEAIDFIRTDESSSREYLSKYTVMDKSIISKVIIVDYWKSDEIILDPLDTYCDILYENGGLDAKINIYEMLYHK